MASPEYRALQRSTSTLCSNISTAADPTWFAQKLLEKGLITPQLQGRTLTLGVPDYDKVSQLLQAVVAQVRANPEKLEELVEILSEEPALEGSVTALTTDAPVKGERGQCVACRQCVHNYQYHS